MGEVRHLLQGMLRLSKHAKFIIKNRTLIAGCANTLLIRMNEIMFFLGVNHQLRSLFQRKSLSP